MVTFAHEGKSTSHHFICTLIKNWKWEDLRKVTNFYIYLLRSLRSPLPGFAVTELV